MAVDIRPVFPEERLLFEILLDKPLQFLDKSVWASNNRYYVDGEPIVVNSSLYKKHSIDYINVNYSKKEQTMRERLSEYVAELFNNMYSGRNLTYSRNIEKLIFLWYN